MLSAEAMLFSGMQLMYWLLCLFAAICMRLCRKWSRRSKRCVVRPSARLSRIDSITNSQSSDTQTSLSPLILSTLTCVCLDTGFVQNESKRNKHPLESVSAFTVHFDRDELLKRACNYKIADREKAAKRVGERETGREVVIKNQITAESDQIEVVIISNIHTLHGWSCQC